MAEDCGTPSSDWPSVKVIAELEAYAINEGIIGYEPGLPEEGGGFDLTPTAGQMTFGVGPICESLVGMGLCYERGYELDIVQNLCDEYNSLWRLFKAIIEGRASIKCFGLFGITLFRGVYIDGTDRFERCGPKERFAGIRSKLFIKEEKFAPYQKRPKSE